MRIPINWIQLAKRTSEYLIDTESSDFLVFHLQSMVNPLVQLDKNAM